jgi:hypothetical protein
MHYNVIAVPFEPDLRLRPRDPRIERIMHEQVRQQG